MSGIAEVLANQNYRVRGSDVADSANVQRLRDRGIEVAIGHAADPRRRGGGGHFLGGEGRQSGAHSKRRTGIPVVPRGELLAELMRLKSAIAMAGRPARHDHVDGRGVLSWRPRPDGNHRRHHNHTARMRAWAKAT